MPFLQLNNILLCKFLFVDCYSCGLLKFKFPLYTYALIIVMSTCGSVRNLMQIITHIAVNENESFKQQFSDALGSSLQQIIVCIC